MNGDSVGRRTLGVDMLMYGPTRIAAGAAHFAEGMTRQFAATSLPSPLVTAYGTALPFAEAALGVLLVAGLRTREAVVAGGLLMTVLVFGTSLQAKWDAVGLQLDCAALFAALLAFRCHDRWSLDHLLARREPAGAPETIVELIRPRYSGVNITWDPGRFDARRSPRGRRPWLRAVRRGVVT